MIHRWRFSNFSYRELLAQRGPRRFWRGQRWHGIEARLGDDELVQVCSSRGGGGFQFSITGMFLGTLGPEILYSSLYGADECNV
jgi:hypothetical protein